MAEKKTSLPSWQKLLKQKSLKVQSNSGQKFRIALVGVGSELNGDDAAGVQVARGLSSAIRPPADFIAIDGGSVPENASGPLRKFKPDWVILVDAADLGETPGAVFWLQGGEIDGMSASSHTLPLSVLGGFLQQEMGCQVDYLGIQPQHLEFAAPLSSAVAAAVQSIISVFKTWTQENEDT
jgi:hydrogenase 3 maturation protease